MKLKVEKIIRETRDASSFVFNNSEAGFTYNSGQFLTLIADVEGEEVRRSYSLSSSPFTEKELKVTVKRVTGGKMSNYLIDKVKEGDELEVLEPMGQFQLEPSKEIQRHVVLIGGGSGITPLISMLKTVLTEEEQSVVSLVNVNSTPDDIIFREEIIALHEQHKDRFRLFNYHSKTEKAVEKKKFLGLGKKVVTEEQGRIDNNKLQAILDGLYISSRDNTQYFICGPNGLMNIAKSVLRKRGVEDSQIFQESFYAEKPGPKQVAAGEETDVTIVIGGEEHIIHVSNQSVLLSALDQGIDLPFSCQSGVCTACMGKCKSGEVEMDFDDALTPAQKEDGYVLTCIGHPKSDDVVISFDE